MGRRFLFAAAPWLVVGGIFASPAVAQPAASESRPDLGHASDGLVGLGRVGVPRTQPFTVALAASAGYGYTESVLDLDDSHHRVSGRLAGSVQPTDYLAIALRLDGRYDTHSGSGIDDDGFVGDPRLTVRGFQELGDFAIGGDLTLWIPGEDAPSFPLDSTSVQAKALADYRVNNELTLVANAGFRLDQSGNAIDDPDRLSLSDRLALGLSDSNAVLVGAGVAYQFSDLVLFGEWTWDLLVGGDAPSAAESPMRVGGGARYFADAARAVELEGRLEATVGGRPTVAVGEPLVPVEPRFAVYLGAVFRWSLHDDPTGAPGAAVPVVPVEAPRVAVIEGQIADKEGQPVVGAAVTAQASDGSSHGPASTAEDGSFRIEGVPLGPATLQIVADGFVERTSLFNVTEGGGSPEPPVVMERDLPNGQIRGIVQSFAGRPIAASVRVEPSGQEVTADSEGGFEIDVPPGDYEVVVTADGYEEQRRPIRVERQGVTILNVDLRRR